MPVETEPERQIERDADELEERIDRLGNHLDEAHKHSQAQAREEEGEDVAGDWEDTDDAAGDEDGDGFDNPEELDLDDEDLLEEGEEEE